MKKKNSDKARIKALSKKIKDMQSKVRLLRMELSMEKRGRRCEMEGKFHMIRQYKALYATFEREILKRPPPPDSYKSL